MPLIFSLVILSGLFVTLYAGQQTQDRRTQAAQQMSLWDNTALPAMQTVNDASAVTLGIKFKASTDGTITGIKFYKGPQNSGTHIGSLWTSTGQLLATATFTNETASGWQQVSFSSPVSVTANTTYVASYFAPSGYYSTTRPYFTNQYSNGSLIALADGAEGGNGLYKYGSTNSFPTATYQSSNYWVDVIFESSSVSTTPQPTATPTPTGSCPANAVICLENQKTGNPASEWDVATASPSTNIYGYAAQMSVNKGETVQFKVNTDSNNYRMDIYRIGYYGGMGARKVATIAPSAPLPQIQPACLDDTTTGLVDCGNWAVSGSWTVPSDAVSGVYVVKLVRQDGTTGSNHIIFVVRDDTSSSDILVKTSDASWQAYNSYGGASLYGGNGPGGDGRAYKVSYNRPLLTRTNGGQYTSFFTSEYPLIRWLEANGYSISYTTDIDTATRGATIQGHKLFISSGHSEYWSREMRTNVESARNAGIHLAFFNGNDIFWKTRWENSIDGSNRPNRTLVCYKETQENAKIDPTSIWTGTWRDPSFISISDGGQPENSLTGQLFMVNGFSHDVLKIPGEFAKMRIWRNTSIANLQPGQVTNFPAGTLGYEWNEAKDNGFAPPGLIKLSETTVTISDQRYLLNYGSDYGTGVATHSLTLYKHPSGALVFGAGTVQWAWGLDSNHDASGVSSDIRMQQATVNLFADMGIQPTYLQPGLVTATKSTDTTPPIATISTLTSGSTVIKGTDVTITGTASDTGGVVGGVEISTDGGTTWRLATGRENWTYIWTPSTTGTTTIKVRATDDSGNIQGTNITSVNVNVIEQTCPCTLFTPNQTPATAALNDTSSVELGVKFRAAKNGYITGLRFYKGTGNTGTHIGNLWSSTGTLLARATFTNEIATGWQQVNFSSPVAVTANTTFVASYFAPSGHYAITRPYFTNEYANGYLTALANGAEGGNGVYKYTTASAFPTNSYSSTNYWVDIIFTDSSSPTPTSTPNPTVTPTTTPSGTQTITFDDITGQDQSLNGQYPAGVSSWGNGSWYHSGPWGKFTSKSISFTTQSMTSGGFTFINPKKLVSLQAYNGGSGSSTVSLSCPGNATKTVSVAQNTIATIITSWANACSSVTVSSSNGWNTNFDNLVIQ